MIISDGILFLTTISDGSTFSDGRAFTMGGGVLELFDSMQTATDNWAVVFMMLVARALMVLVAALTW